MALTPLKVLFFLFGGVAAATGTAYVTGALDPYLAPGPVGIASLPDPAALDDPKVESDDAAVPDPAAPGEDEPELSRAPALIVPSFDLLRVEQDGSIVIAGKAAPNSVVEIVNGATILGRTDVGPSGDFVVALDDRLKPGDYQIVLRSTTGDNVVATSTETAIVSVPDRDAGQVLALVEQPGAPSKLITVPEPAIESDEAAPATEETVAVADEPAAEPGPAAPDEPAVPVAKAPQEEPVAPEAAAVEDDVPADGEDVVSAPEEPVAVDETPEAVAEAPAEPEELPAGEQVAHAEPAKPDSAPAMPSKAPRVAVEAVEIDGRKVFVAGMADPGATIRVYANDFLLGQTVASEGGRFLIEANRDLPVGGYIVRADLLAADGVKVLARAAVPFEREPGENVAAVAPQPAPVEEVEAPAADEDPAVPAPEVADGPADAQEPAAVDAPETVEAPDAPDAAEVARVEEDAVPEVVSPKLESVDGAVIIRRGDTLWKISRRVYGRGVRYTTIYLANQDQIRNPDRIWPGQVFDVPNNSGDGESADLTTMGDQVVR